jgi:GT2 family glycosyltransferase
MEFSFVILSWNSLGHLEKCLNSIACVLGDSCDYEVFVVDNGSQDGSIELLNVCEAQEGSKVKPIYLDHNTGTTYSRNLALKKCVGKYVVVLDSDVELHDNTLDVLVAQFKTQTNVGMVVPRLLYGSGRLQKSTDVFPTLARKIVRFLWLKKIEAQEAQEAFSTKVSDVDYAISAFWVIPKVVIDQVGLLDEKIFYAPEDVDYCLRIWKQGFRILYVPESVATHDAQEISRGFKLNKAKIEHIKGLIYYFIKHKYLFKKPTIRL